MPVADRRRGGPGPCPLPAPDDHTSKEDSSIYAYGVFTDPPGALQSDDLEGGSFDVGDTFRVDQAVNSDANTPNLVTLIYEHPDGTVVTVHLMADANGALPTDKCVIAGTAVGA